MTEWEFTARETAEEVGRALMERIEKTEFGTPEFLAVSDYLHLKQTEKSLSVVQRNAISKELGSEDRMYWESKARIDEHKIALLEVQIYQNRSRVKGYDKAFTYVGIEFEEELMSKAYGEARELFTEEDKQKRYATDLHSKFFFKAQSIIDGKRNEEK
jgi:hypothetical protein